MEQIDRENHAIRMSGGGHARLEVSDAAKERNRMSTFGQYAAGSLGIGGGSDRVSEVRLAAAAQALSRFPEFKVRLNEDGSAWVASVKAIYGRESVYHEAQWENPDMRVAVIGLFEAMSAPDTYVGFREHASRRKGTWSNQHYAIWEGEGYHDCGWLIRARDEVAASGDELAENGPWSRLRPAFMKPGYEWPGAAGERREDGDEPTVDAEVPVVPEGFIAP